MILIIVDATSIISALLGGISREILFSPQYVFVTTQHTIGEVKKYIPYISEKSGVKISEIEEELDLLPIIIYEKDFYLDKFAEATEILGKIDVKDIDLLALTLKTSRIIWSDDKHFEKVKGITLLKTKDFF